MWSLRLGGDETGVELSDVRLFGEATVGEVKLNGSTVEGEDLAVAVAGNGHANGGSPSDSGLSEEDEETPRRRGRGRGRGGRGGRGGRAGRASKKEGETERVEPKRWDVPALVVGSNTVEVKAGGGDDEEVWRIFVERVV